MIDADPAVLGLQFVGSAIVGGLLGFGAKRIAKLLVVIAGVQLMLLRFLEAEGVIVVDWTRLSADLLGVQTDARVQAEHYWVDSLLSTLSLGAGFTSGFLIGFHRG